MRSDLLINFILFQVGWFACVIFGGTEMAWIGTVVVTLIVIHHIYRSSETAPELKLIVYTMLIGMVWDSILTMSMLMTFDYGQFIDAMAPHWLIAMWALFATTLNVSLSWMKGKYLLAAIFGGIGGPAAYYAGHELGAVQFGDMQTSLIVIGIGWAVIMPNLIYLTNSHDGYRTRFERVPA